MIDRIAEIVSVSQDGDSMRLSLFTRDRQARLIHHLDAFTAEQFRDEVNEVLGALQDAEVTS